MVAVIDDGVACQRGGFGRFGEAADHGQGRRCMMAANRIQTDDRRLPCPGPQVIMASHSPPCQRIS